MKRVAAKLLVSLIGILVAAPLFVFALILGARAVSVSQGAQDDLLLAVLALSAAGASIVKGMGRRAERGRGVSTIHLGY